LPAERQGRVDTYSPRALAVAAKSGLKPVRVLSADEIKRRLDEAHASGLPGIPVSEAYDMQPESADARGVWCVFGVNGDNVHVTDGMASGHGWWFNVNCPSGTRANTHIDQVENIYGNWMIVGSGDKDGVLPGSGSGKWANARSFCNNASPTQYYSLVDADLVGRMEVPMTAHTDTVTIPCL
jgi:hypothetical protein